MFPLTEQRLLTKQYEELIDISTDTGLKDTQTDKLLGWSEGGVSSYFKCSCEEATCVSAYVSV
jgi:hypothetical protein